MNIRPVGAELFYAEGLTGGRTDMTNLKAAFRNFANAPQKNAQCSHCVYALCCVLYGSQEKQRLLSCITLTG
jgi:hypothetical protein